MRQGGKKETVGSIREVTEVERRWGNGKVEKGRRRETGGGERRKEGGGIKDAEEGEWRGGRQVEEKGKGKGDDRRRREAGGGVGKREKAVVFKFVQKISNINTHIQYIIYICMVHI
jgi:hypothetical protein